MDRTPAENERLEKLARAIWLKHRPKNLQLMKQPLDIISLIGTSTTYRRLDGLRAHHLVRDTEFTIAPEHKPAGHEPNEVYRFIQKCVDYVSVQRISDMEYTHIAAWCKVTTLSHA
jgi:hypothetical protein